nr:type III-A CRISPR-associated RAMP protein Csm3 [Candidatus Sigynarchaeota archaeon]
MAELQLHGKLIIKGKIEAKTGLAIGGNKATLEIGGIDNPVIKDSKGRPYIPGSSLKGKIRSLLEKSTYPLRYKEDEKSDNKGYFLKNSIHVGSGVDDIWKLFGAADMEEPGRGIFRDSSIDAEYFAKNKEELFVNLDLDFTEDKVENSIDRISAVAKPRHAERVPRGTRFDFEIIIDMYRTEDKNLLKLLVKGMKLLEVDYLGKSGTRGYGKVKFLDITMTYYPLAYYSGKADSAVNMLPAPINDLDAITEEKWYQDVLGKIAI